MVNATSGEEGGNLVASGTKRKILSSSMGLQMQNRFILLKAEEMSAVPASTEPGSPNSKSCKTTKK